MPTQAHGLYFHSRPSFCISGEWSLATPPPFSPPLTQSLHCKHNGAATANSELLVVLQKGWYESMECYSLARAQPLQTFIEVYTFTISSTARTAAAFFPATRSLMLAVHLLALRKLQFRHRLRLSTALIPIMEESDTKG